MLNVGTLQRHRCLLLLTYQRKPNRSKFSNSRFSQSPLTPSLLLHVTNKRQLLPFRHWGVRVVDGCWLRGVELVANATFGCVHIVFWGVWVARYVARGATAGLPCLLRNINFRKQLRNSCFIFHNDAFLPCWGSCILRSAPLYPLLHLCKRKSLNSRSLTHSMLSSRLANDSLTFRRDKLDFDWIGLQFKLPDGLSGIIQNNLESPTEDHQHQQ